MTRDEVKALVVDKMQSEVRNHCLWPEVLADDQVIDDTVGVMSLGFVCATIEIEEALELSEETSLPWDDESIVHGVTLDTIVDFIMNHLPTAS